MKIISPSIVILFFIGCSVKVPLQERIIDNKLACKELFAHFPVHWHEKIQVGVTDFIANHDDLSCRKINAYQKGSSIIVEIYSPIKVVFDNDKITVGASDNCQGGVIYEIDNSGKIIKSRGVR